MSRLYIPQGITLEALTSQLGELGELDSELGRDAIATHQLMLDLRSKRQQAGRYAPDDVAAMLAEQTEQDASYWMAKISGAWSSGLLKFWLQDGTPCDHLSGMERYLGLDNEYTTSEAVNDWIEAWGAKFSFACDGKPVELKGQTQDRLILEQIDALGYDPKALPKQVAGMAGVKKEVKDKLDKKEPFEARTAFDESWKRLRGYGDIKDS